MVPATNLFLALALCLSAAPVGLAHGSSTVPVGGAKIGMINLNKAIRETAEYKKALADLPARLAPRYVELADMNKQIDEIRKRLEMGGSLSQREEDAQAQVRGAHLFRLADLRKKELEEEERAEKAFFEAQVRIRITSLVDRYAFDNDFTLMLDSSAGNSSVIFSGRELDVTDRIVALYDSFYFAREAGKPPPNSTKESTNKPQ